MTETHKAAVEALNSYPNAHEHREMPLNDFRELLATWVLKNHEVVKDGLLALKQPSSVEVTEWHSVDTAPRDGTPILALEKYSDSPAIVKFRNNRWAQYSDGMPVEDLDAKILCLNEEGMIWKPIRMPVDGLRITRAAATDGVE